MQGSMSWNTLDSDPAVFTQLISDFGVKDVQCDELYSLDELLEISPVYGVIFLFKYYSTAAEEHANYETGDELYFAKQIIQNACATQAVLNVLLNKQEDVDIGEELGNFKSFTSSFEPELKGETMTNSELLRTVHNSFSSANPFVNDDEDPQNVDADNDGLYHFIGYIEKQGVVYELDGLKPYPINHGSAQLADVIQKRISTFKASELRFSLVVLTNDKLKQYQAIGDEEGVAREQAKRARWKKENALRRQDFIGLNFELAKLVGAAKSDEQWEKMLDGGRVEMKGRRGV